MMTAFLLQRDSGARAARNLTFSRRLLSSAILIQAVNVNTREGNGHGQPDLFPSTHWSVVLAAGRSEAEPEIAGAALAELCQIYWVPLYRAFSLTCSNTKFTLARTGRKADSAHFSSPP